MYFSVGQYSYKSIRKRKKNTLFEQKQMTTTARGGFPRRRQGVAAPPWRESAGKKGGVGLTRKNTLTVLDGRGGILYRGDLETLPLKEALILKKSILFFNDAEPCFIHRSAVMKRIFAGLEDYLEEAQNPEQIDCAGAPDEIRETLGSVPGAVSLRWEAPAAPRGK